MSVSQHRKKKRKSLTKGPALFSEVGKEAKDLLEKGYIKDHEFSFSTRSSTGVILTSTTVKHGKHLNSHVAAKYSYKDATIDVKVDSKSQLSASLTFSGKFMPSTKTIASLKLPAYSSSELSASFTFSGKLAPSTKTIASLNLPAYSSSELKIQYFHEHVALVTSILLNQSPTTKFSASIGTQKIAFAMEAEYKTTSCSTNYNAGIYVANRKYNASIILANQGDLLKAAYVHHFNRPKKVAVAAEIKRKFSAGENTFTVGGSCRVDRLTTVKVDLNNHGKLKTLLRHEIIPQSSLSISSEFDMKALDRIPRIGLALALKGF